MNEFFENSKRIVDFIKDRPWLFTNNPYLSVEKYLKYFEYGKDSEFHIFPTMLPYKLSILEKYKDKVYNTMFLANGPSTLGLHTIIQTNPNAHVVFMWANSNDNREAILYATLHAAAATDYVLFLKENESFVYDETAQRSGFFGQQT